VHLRNDSARVPRAGVGRPSSTVSAVLIRLRLHRLVWLDWPTGRPVCREEPGEPIRI